MHKVYFLCVVCGVIFFATSTVAQLSANPWVNVNTKEQVNQVYEKHQRRGYYTAEVEYVEDSEVIIEKTQEHIQKIHEEENKEPSFMEKIVASFDKEEPVETEQTQEQEIDDSNNMEASASSSLPSIAGKVTELKDSFKLPSFNTNNMIRKFEKSIGVDFKAMAKKFK